MGCSIAIIGDLMVDVISHIPTFGPRQIAALKSVQSSVKMKAGGTGVVAAVAAKSAGFDPVWLLGSLGMECSRSQKPDTPAQILLEELRQSNIHPVIELDRNKPTGTVVILYLKDDQRIMVAEKGANASFGLCEMNEEVDHVLSKAKILFVSGYSLLHEDQAKTVKRIMQISRNHGNQVVLDLVPHNSFAHLNADTFEEYTSDVSIIISETKTLRRVLRHELMPKTEDSSESQVYDIAELLLRRNKGAILRPDNDNQYFFNKTGLIEKVSTGYCQSDMKERAGFLDRLAMKSLFLYVQSVA